jgi:hypothetical protein
MSKERWTTTEELKHIDDLITPPKTWACRKNAGERLKTYIHWGQRRLKWGTWGTVDGRKAVQYASKKLRGLK